MFERNCLQDGGKLLQSASVLVVFPISSMKYSCRLFINSNTVYGTQSLVV